MKNNWFSAKFEKLLGGFRAEPLSASGGNNNCEIHLTNVTFESSVTNQFGLATQLNKMFLQERRGKQN